MSGKEMNPDVKSPGRGRCRGRVLAVTASLLLLGALARAQNGELIQTVSTLSGDELTNPAVE